MTHTTDTTAPHEVYPGQIHDDLVRDVRIGLNVAMGHFAEVAAFNATEHKPTPLRDVKPGEYVRLKPSPTAPVWIRGEYDRTTKRYSLTKADDVNHESMRKGDLVVYIGFTY